MFEFVNRPNYKPLKPRVIAKRLGIDEATAVAETGGANDLSKTGQLAYGANHLVLPAARHREPKSADEDDEPSGPSGKQSRGEFTGEARHRRVSPQNGRLWLRAAQRRDAGGRSQRRYFHPGQSARDAA